jgi:hypothetical protein
MRSKPAARSMAMSLGLVDSAVVMGIVACVLFISLAAQQGILIDDTNQVRTIIGLAAGWWLLANSLQRRFVPRLADCSITTLCPGALFYSTVITGTLLEISVGALSSGSQYGLQEKPAAHRVGIANCARRTTYEALQLTTIQHIALLRCGTLFGQKATGG